ncbi:MAG: tetratricopeptide repeat protein [Pseudomonadota bacterium]
MDKLNRFCRRATLCGSALLLCFSLSASADEIQDISKLLKQGQQAKALERVDAYLASKPKDAQARFLKGLILTEQNKTADAIRVFTELTEDYPELPEPYNNLAVLYASQNQYEKARVALEMAIRTHPSYATAHENLGDIYAKLASQAYDRALQLDHNNTSTQTKLAMIKDLFTGTKGSKGSKATHVATSETAPPPSAPTPATAPTEATSGTAGKTVAGNKDEVLKAVQGWASAWSAKNVKDYLAFYAKDFKTPGGESRSAWEAQRNTRISKPAAIEVTVNAPNVVFTDENHATVSFKQSYRASHLTESSNKTLVMVKDAGNWLIQEERSK